MTTKIVKRYYGDVDMKSNKLHAVGGIELPKGTWTPTVTCGTPGDLAVTYATRVGKYTRIDNVVVAAFQIAMSAFSHTSASGAIIITGLPFVAIADSFVPVAAWAGFNSAGYTALGGQIVGTLGNIYLTKSGAGMAYANAAIGDFPSGGTPCLYGTIMYFA